MKQTLFIWLAGRSRHPQYIRMCALFEPLFEELRALGYDPVCKSIITDDYGAAPEAYHIWIANDYGEAPPTSGPNVLWFLSQMKITTRQILLEHDAIVTASPDHAVFLKNWIGDTRHIARASWPIDAALAQRRGGPKTNRIELEAAEDEHARLPQELGYSAVQIENLPADPAALYDYFACVAQMVSRMPVRERMTGFCRFEELIGIIAGTHVTSEERVGLPDYIAPLIGDFATDAPAERSARTAKLIERVLHEHDPKRIAKRLVNAIKAAVKQHKQNQKPIQLIAQEQSPTADIADDLPEQEALLRDRAYVLGHKALPPLLAEQTANNTLGSVWAPKLGPVNFAAACPTPWTDLSLARIVLDEAQAGRYRLTPNDADMLRALTRALCNYCPGDMSRPLAMDTLPAIPWDKVNEASRDAKRSFMDLSRTLNAHSLYRFSQRVGRPKALAAPLPVRTEPSASFLSRSGVFLHAFYLQVAGKILDTTLPILGQCPLFVSTDTDRKAAELRRYLTKIGWAQHHVRVVPNVGRDIFPKLCAFAPEHGAFEYVLHLHTKRSPHSPSLKTWGQNIIGGLAGSEQAVQRISAAFSDNAQLGVIYADPPNLLHPAMSWTRNLRIAELASAATAIGALPNSADLDFPVGSMFWARRAALDTLLGAGFCGREFPPEAAQEDGTLAHAIERLIGVGCINSGYQLGRIMAQ